jgi:hypothetical protein
MTAFRDRRRRAATEISGDGPATCSDRRQAAGKRRRRVSFTKEGDVLLMEVVRSGHGRRESCPYAGVVCFITAQSLTE